MVWPEADVTGEHKQAARCNWQAAAEVDTTGKQQPKWTQSGAEMDTIGSNQAT